MSTEQINLKSKRTTMIRHMITSTMQCLYNLEHHLHYNLDHGFVIFDNTLRCRSLVGCACEFADSDSWLTSNSDDLS
jgi:hypothetical protein